MAEKAPEKTLECPICEAEVDVSGLEDGDNVTCKECEAELVIDEGTLELVEEEEEDEEEDDEEFLDEDEDDDEEEE